MRKHCVLLELTMSRGEHFAGMPTVADGIGVKNRENLPTSQMDGPYCIFRLLHQASDSLP